MPRVHWCSISGWGLVLVLSASCGDTTTTAQCDAKSCVGCCAADVCIAVDQQSSTSCGTGGLTCATCGDQLVCQSGACVPIPTCAVSNGGCDLNATCAQLALGVSCACRAGYVAQGGGCAPLLASLSVSPGFLSPVFDPQRASYGVVAPKGTTAVTVTGAAQDVAGTELSINGTKAGSTSVTLAGASTSIQVRVRAKATSRTWLSTVAVTTGASTLLQRAAFKPTVPGAGLRFGAAVAVSGDGNTVAVGAPFDSSDAIGVNGTPGATEVKRSGAVFVFVRKAAVWALEAYVKAPNREALDVFGGAVALSGDGSTLLVGATGEDSVARGVGGNQQDNTATDSGAAYVFRRTGTTWALEAYLKAPNSEVQDGFGWAVALSLDGSTAVVGAPFEDGAGTGVDPSPTSNGASGAGAAYLFTRSGVAWSTSSYLKASNTGAADGFGRAVALSGDGLVVAVGAAGEDSTQSGAGEATDGGASSSGAAYVYRRSSVTTFEAYLKASNTAAQARFGSSLSLSQDGTVLAIGAPNDSGNLDGGSVASSGAAYVFRKATGWSEEAYLKGMPPDQGDWAGTSVALSGDGNTLAIGAPNEDGQATGIDGTVDNLAAESGAVFLYRRATSWSPFAYVKASNTGAGDQFGSAVCLSSNGAALVAGAPAEDSDSSGVTDNLANNASGDRGASFFFQE